MQAKWGKKEKNEHACFGGWGKVGVWFHQGANKNLAPREIAS